MSTFEERTSKASYEYFNYGPDGDEALIRLSFQAGARFAREDAIVEILGLLRSDEASDDVYFAADWLEQRFGRKE